MENNIGLHQALIHSMSKDMSVSDLVRTAELMKQSGPEGSVENLYDTWIRHNSENPLLFAVLFNYSVVLSENGKLEAAQDALAKAIEINPDFMQAYINLGRIYERRGSVGLAVAQWSAALAKLEAVNGQSITHKTILLNQSARTLEAANQDEAAENTLKQSLEIDGRQREVIQHLIALRQRQCEWPVIKPSERVSQKTLMEGMSPLSAGAYSDDPLLQLAMHWNYNIQDVGVPAQLFDKWPAAEEHNGPLKIGYLSSDLREHAVGYLITDVLGTHDHSKVEIYSYYCGPKAADTDELHKHFQKVSDKWRDITAMDDASAAKLMIEDGIQILVDLNGYTREARLKLVAMRPAPVIVNWLGFPGSMASPYHHYIVADDKIIPEENEIYYTEEVLRLPCYQPSVRDRQVANHVPTREEAKLPEDKMVYCCFNGIHKLTRFTFERWLMILERVPDSVLWLLSSTETANERLRSYAAERGIDKERIIFADKLKNAYHLARYQLADLFLDTTPYGAHTTGSDALWAGVPVLTLSGRSFASRVCGSLVSAAGIPEMICKTADEYVERAVEYGLNRELLDPIRKKIKDNRDSCTLLDMQLLVTKLEELYHDMWEKFKANELPQPDLTNLDVYFEVGCSDTYDNTEVQLIEDYRGWWLDNLAKRHKYRPMPTDSRLVASLDLLDR